MSTQLHRPRTSSRPLPAGPWPLAPGFGQDRAPLTHKSKAFQLPAGIEIKAQLASGLLPDTLKKPEYMS